MQENKDLENIDDIDEEGKELKRKFALWIHDSTIENIKEHYPYDNCKSISEFIEKAINFYIEYLAAGKCTTVLPKIVTASIKDIARESNNKQGRMMFKMAVELAVLSNVIAAQQDLSPDVLDRIRGACTNEVKRINGTISFEDAVRWQN